MIQRSQQCRSLLFALLAIVAVTASQAQQVPKTQIIHAGKLIDVRTGQVTTDAYITVSGERIAAISTSAPAPGTTGDPVIDLSQFTIVPGLIDAHGHVLSDPTTQSSASYTHRMFSFARKNQVSTARPGPPTWVGSALSC